LNFQVSYKSKYLGFTEGPFYDEVRFQICEKFLYGGWGCFRYERDYEELIGDDHHVEKWSINIEKVEYENMDVARLKEACKSSCWFRKGAGVPFENMIGSNGGVQFELAIRTATPFGESVTRKLERLPAFESLKETDFIVLVHQRILVFSWSFYRCLFAMIDFVIVTVFQSCMFSLIM